MSRYILKKVLSNVGKMDNGTEYDYCRIECEMPIRETEIAFGFGTRVFEVGTHENIKLFDAARQFLKTNQQLDYQPVVVEFEYSEEMSTNEKLTRYFVIPETIKLILPQRMRFESRLGFNSGITSRQTDAQFFVAIFLKCTENLIRMSRLIANTANRKQGAVMVQLNRDVLLF